MVYTLNRVTLILLVLSCACGCFIIEGVEVEHRCIFDELMQKVDTVPRVDTRNALTKRKALTEDINERSKTHRWKPIRIVVSTEDFKYPSRYCVKAKEKRFDYISAHLECTEDSILTAEKNKTLLDVVIPAAVKMHRERLFVEPVKGRLVVGNMSDICTNFIIPKRHRKIGLHDADTVIYAAAAPTSDAIAWAMLCAVYDNLRPVIGALNVNPAYVGRPSIVIRVVAHEIAHSLGFHQGLFEALNLTSKMPNVRGKTAVVINGPKTVEKSREFFNCSSLVGMELEDAGGHATRLSHWKRRNALHEMMSGTLYVDTAFYSMLTMAVFEDMGFYRARWGMEESMAWGRNAGCSLLNEACATNSVTKFPEMFCVSPTPDHEFRCSSGHVALGACDMIKQTNPVQKHFQYFSQETVSGSSPSMDFCPYIRPYQGAFCVDGDSVNMPGSFIGINSRCVEGEGMSLRDGTRVSSGICVDTLCTNKTLYVRFLGDNEWRPCPEKEKLNATGVIATGHITCPPTFELCHSREHRQEVMSELLNNSTTKEIDTISPSLSFSGDMEEFIDGFIEEFSEENSPSDDSTAPLLSTVDAGGQLLVIALSSIILMRIPQSLLV
ncbi:putative Leishmanolysin [Trypanosoma vivax]|uniref:Leishmanolysin-like peptidase n=1 Tax=Trypanosoma vivax (strain Y486) TaxID=1055687 RepID=G0U4A6_TRYVY|nr:putative surface protease GP63 [Trypanosoma vivax]KAH8611288.1 putative Leishmanolysin [Trypanosoma vivax]CCC52269.1 putative surface protease GP63 [Trypanosoma vivax Y486]